MNIELTEKQFRRLLDLAEIVPAVAFENAGRIGGDQGGHLVGCHTITLLQNERAELRGEKSVCGGQMS